MKKIIKLISIVVGLVLLLALVLVIYVTTRDPNDYKDMIAARMQARTGQELTMNGDIRVTWYPWLGLEVNDVTLNNPGGSGTEPFLHLDHASVRIKTLPLLHDQYIIDTVHIHGAALNLVKSKGSTGDQQESGGTLKNMQHLKLPALLLGGVEIKDARLNWRDPATGTVYTIKDLDMNTGELVFGQPIDLKMQVVAAANHPEINGNASMTGTIAYDLDRETITIKPLRLNAEISGPKIPRGRDSLTFTAEVAMDLAAGTAALTNVQLQALALRANGEVRATNIRSGAPALTTALDIQGTDLALLFKVAEVEPLASQLAGLGDRRFTLKSHLQADLDLGDISVPDFTADLLGATIKGKAQAHAVQSKAASYQGDLNATGPDLPALMQVAGAAVPVLKEYGSRLSGIPESQKAFAIDTALDADMGSGDVHIPRLELRALGLNVHGNLQAQGLADNGRIEGSLNVDEFNLRRLLQQLQVGLPPMADVNALGKVALNTALTGSRTSLAMQDLKLILDDTTLKGKFALGKTDNITSEFDLDVDSLNADRYLPPKQEGKQPQQPSRQEATKLPVDTIRTLQANGKLHIGKFTVAKATMNNVNLTLSGKNGVVKLDPMTADLYQGSHKGDITLNASDKNKQPRLTINTALQGVQLEQLMADVTGKRKVRGSANLSAALFAVGENTDQIKRTVNGQMSFSIQNGALIGYNLGRIMRMGNQLQESMTLKVSDQEETDFSEMTGNPVVTNGVVKLDDLNMKSPGLRLSGTGVLANLPENSLDYLLTARIVATAKGQGGKDITEGKLEGVPLECRFQGSLDDPNRKCDATKLMMALGLKVLQGVGKLPVDIIQKGTEAIKSGGSDLFGGFLNQLTKPKDSPAKQNNTAPAK